MAIVTTDNQHYTDIAAAIRSKNGTETQYKPSEMAAAIQAISGGGGEPEPPDDGKTRLYITIPANAMPDRPPPRNQVPLYIQQSVANGVTIDWGDGTAPETLPGTGAVNTKHAYEQAGDYVISLDPAEGCELGLGSNSTSYCIIGATGNVGKSYCNMLKKVYVGKNVWGIDIGAFYFCGSLASIIFFYRINIIGNYAFSNCNSLISIKIPDSVKSIGNFVFVDCGSLVSMVIPDSVTYIGEYTFQSCYGIKEYHFLAVIPPTLDSNVFLNILSDCIIYVPKGSAEAYKTATNWSKYAKYIQEEPA